MLRELCYETIATIVEQTKFDVFTSQLAPQLYPLFQSNVRLTSDLLALGALLRKYVLVKALLHVRACVVHAC